jgi:hypothetical protein
VGLDSHKIVGAESELFYITAFIKALRVHPWLSQAYILFVGEKNSGHDSGHVARPLLEGFKGIIPVKEHENKDYGWWTSNNAKLKYAYSCRYALTMGSVFVMKDCVTVNPWIKGPPDKRIFTYNKLVAQMKRYKPTYTTPTTAFSARKVTVSGKVDEHGKLSSGVNDDLFMTFTMACHFLDEFMYRRIPNLDYDLLYRMR